MCISGCNQPPVVNPSRMAKYQVRSSAFPCVGVLDLGNGSEDAHQPHLGPYPGGLVPGAGVQVDDVRLDRVRACGLLGCSRWRCRDRRQGQKGDGDGDKRTDGPARQQSGVFPVPLCANTVQHRRTIVAVAMPRPEGRDNPVNAGVTGEGDLRATIPLYLLFTRVCVGRREPRESRLGKTHPAHGAAHERRRTG